MNVQHKCLFHPANSILKFCENRQCTLPLCSECQPIHLQEHHSQQSQAKVLRFNEAALKAVNNMEDYLEQFKKFEREAENKIENDREVVMKMVDQYYHAARKMVGQIKANVGKVTDSLNKLKKGSIKALIFYYSGDVKMNDFDLQFEPLQVKVRNLLLKKEQKRQINVSNHSISANHASSIINQAPAQVVNYIPIQISSEEVEPRFTHRPKEQVFQRQRTVNMRSIDQEAENIFSNIQEIKEQKNATRARKSIFDQNKRSNISQNNLSTNEIDSKYNYQPNRYEPQVIQNTPIEPNQKFNYEVNYQHKNLEKNNQQPEILSFQNRFLNKFTCAEPTDRRDTAFVSTEKQLRRPEPKYDEIYNRTILRPEDLQIQKQNARAVQPNHLTQRNRSMSQNHLPERQIRKTNYDYDLKKQVLSPEEIRRMLERKIQQRNRVLSIKKTDNYPIVEEKGKKWETRDSIINQIYSEPKY